jgi:hypothetical protein
MRRVQHDYLSYKREIVRTMSIAGNATLLPVARSETMDYLVLAAIALAVPLTILQYNITYPYLIVLLAIL